VKNSILIASFIVLSTVVARDARACEGCCIGAQVTCCYSICGTSQCTVQKIGGLPYCVRSGSCEDIFCFLAEHQPEFVMARCKAPETRHYALISVKIKHRAA
jgi:hypothetical protein